MAEIINIADLPFPLGIPQDIPQELRKLAEAGEIVIIGSGDNAMVIPVKRGKINLLKDRVEALSKTNLIDEG